ncbi:MAG: hypothetical protein GY785_04440 [Gammaproteobacteria bacterium]|nr:hypothetical protein [Gammaproteobacteria bacterium]
MAVAYLDCSAEVSAWQHAASDRLVRPVADIGAQDYVVNLPTEALHEIASLIDYFAHNPLPLLRSRALPQRFQRRRRSRAQTPSLSTLASLGR